MTAPRHKAIISIGANIAEARAAVARAIERLSEAGTVTARSDIYTTAAVGAGALTAPPYANAVAELSTSHGLAGLTALLKRMETEAGRSPLSPLVALDLDVVIYDGTVVRPTDASRSYFTTGYAQITNAQL